MAQQYEARRSSITDRVTLLQVQAWEQENNALRIKAEGFGAYIGYHRDLAAQYRQTDRHNKITELFDKSDAQNAIIDIGLKMKERKVPLLEESNMPFIRTEVDYTLIEQ